MIDFLIKRFIREPDKTTDPKVREAYGTLAGLVGIVCNVILFFAKLAIGLLSGSISITADAVNNLSDASANITTLLGFRMAAKPADAEHPYGHARSEYVSGLMVALMILLVGFELLKSSVEKILHPTPVEFSWALVAVLALSIAVKLWMGAFNRRLGGRIHSATLEATAQDSVNDCISTGAVLIAALIAHFSGLQLDGFMGAGVALFILYAGYQLVRDTLSPLLGEAPEKELVELVAGEMLKEPKVLGVHDLMVHNYGPGRCFASAHAEVDAAEDVLECHDAIDNIERRILAEHNVHLVIHYDPIMVGDPFVDEMRQRLREVVAEIDPRLSVHDVRVVRGPDHTNLIFDVVKPYDLKMTDQELIAAIDGRVKQLDASYFTVITVDNDFTGLRE